MNEFVRVLQSWQPFYMTIATAAATLVGLLFVSLSFNRKQLDTRALLSARQTFANMLDVLLIAVIFLIPHAQVSSLILALFVFGVARLIGALKEIITSIKKHSAGKSLFGALRENGASLLSSFSLMLLAYAILRENVYAMFLPVIVIMVLVGFAARNAWDLLLKE